MIYLVLRVHSASAQIRIHNSHGTHFRTRTKCKESQSNKKAFESLCNKCATMEKNNSNFVLFLSVRSPASVRNSVFSIMWAVIVWVRASKCLYPRTIRGRRHSVRLISWKFLLAFNGNVHRRQCTACNTNATDKNDYKSSDIVWAGERRSDQRCNRSVGRSMKCSTRDCESLWSLLSGSNVLWMRAATWTLCVFWLSNFPCHIRHARRYELCARTALKRIHVR